MECHECGRQVARGDRYCTGCGTSLQGVTDTTQVHTAVEEPVAEPDELNEPADTDELALEPHWAPTGQVPAIDTTDLPATQPVTEVLVAERTATATTTASATTTATTTAQMPTVVVTAQPNVSPTLAPRRFTFGAVTLIALVTSGIALAAMFTTVLSITSDVRLVVDADTSTDFRTGTWILDDLADNLSIAGLIAIVSMVAGGLASGFHWRWGSGLAGGAGFALAGLAALAVGLAQMPIDAAHTFASIPSETPFVLTITRDLGYWMLVASGALGVVLFFASVNDAFGDRRPGLDPWIAALGALAVLVAAAGPLLPEEQAVFSDNWYLTPGPGEAPALLLVGRLTQIGFFFLGGVVGFLCVRRWGLGVAVGVSLPAIWLTGSVLLDLTDRPVGFGYRNPGATDMHVHGVTIIGVAAVLGMLVLGVVAAYEQSRRHPRS